MYACVYVCIGVKTHRESPAYMQPLAVCSGGSQELIVIAKGIHLLMFKRHRKAIAYTAPRLQGRTLVEIEGNAHPLNWSLAPHALLLIHNFVFVVSDCFALGDIKRIL